MELKIYGARQTLLFSCADFKSSIYVFTKCIEGCTWYQKGLAGDDCYGPLTMNNILLKHLYKNLFISIVASCLSASLLKALTFCMLHLFLFWVLQHTPNVAIDAALLSLLASLLFFIVKRKSQQFLRALV